MLKKIKNTKAFSMIEVSVVILVIGLLMAAITNSSLFFSKYRLNVARTLTESSPVTVTKGLRLWLDTTSKKSFADTETSDTLKITTWYDRNPLPNARYTITQSTANNKATYTTNCINVLPCLRFNGSSNYYYFDSSYLINSDFTIFVVEQRRTNANGNFFISGDAGTLNANAILGYRYDGTVTFSMYSNDLDATVPTYLPTTPKIHVFGLSSVTGKTYYMNGTLMGSEPTQTALLVSFANSSIGLSNISNFYYNGDIGEIIIFDRNLTYEERRNIESYLSQKWKISIS